MKIFLFSLVAFVYTSCGKCYNESESFEGFDLAILDNTGISLISENSRYDVDDVHLMVNDIDIIYGYYKANDIYYFLVDFSGLQPGDYVGQLELYENEHLNIDMNISWDEDGCFPHNDLNRLNVEGDDYEVNDEYKVHIIK